MAATWQIRLKGLDGALDAIIDDYEQFTLSKIVNGVGTFALRLRADDAKAALFVLDSQVEFWRRDVAQALAWYNEAEYLTRGTRYILTREGAYLVEISGVAYTDLLKRRTVFNTATTPGAWTGKAETVIKGLVKDQADADVTVAARGLTGLTIQADGAAGNTVTLDASDKNLLETCQAIAATGGGDFDMVGNGAAAFVFNWYAGQRGTDRSASVTFAPELGNMAEADLQLLRHDEINTILVGGQDSGTSRVTAWRETTTLTDDSTWNRREQFVNASQETATAGLNTQGDAELWQGRPQNQFTCVVLQMAGRYYGQHYGWGDKVTARFGTYSATKKIQSVTITVSASEAESIKLELVDP